VFNWIVSRYGEKGNKWNASDDFVWGGFLYHILDFVFLIVFVTFVYWMAGIIYERYGVFRGAAFLVVMVLIRLNSLIRKTDMNNRLLKQVVENGDRTEKALSD
jgi:hypothetical protein